MKHYELLPYESNDNDCWLKYDLILTFRPELLRAIASPHPFFLVSGRSSFRDWSSPTSFKHGIISNSTLLDSSTKSKNSPYFGFGLMGTCPSLKTDSMSEQMLADWSGSSNGYLGQTLSRPFSTRVCSQLQISGKLIHFLMRWHTLVPIIYLASPVPSPGFFFDQLPNKDFVFNIR